jgi:S-formylglutathione hydrolase FrmB
LGLTVLNPTLAQDPYLVKQCVIPETNEHGEINFGIMVPPSFEKESVSYPLIFYLHGMNNYYAGPRAQWIASYFQKQITEGQLPDFLMVFVDGQDGFWCDHHDGDPLLETELVKYLIPYLDKNYPTNPSKRLIMGFSAGGNGAITFYAKHPELFKGVISLDGGIISHEDFLYRIGEKPDIIGDESYFYEYCSPYKWVKRNRHALIDKADTSILLTAGFILDANKEFLSVLKEQEIPAKLVEFGYDHEFRYVLSQSEDELMRFINKRLNQVQ